MRTKKSFIKTPLGILLATTLAIGALVGAYFLAKTAGAPIYHRWNQDKLLKQAQSLYDEQKYTSAMVSVRKIVQRYHDNTEAWELGLKIAEAENSSEAITFSYMLQQRQPTLENKLRTIEQSLKFGSYGMARNLLRELPPEAATDRRTHENAIEIYKVYKDSNNLKAHLRSLISIDPDNSNARFEYALIQLASSDAPGEMQMIAQLEELADTDEEKDTALRAVLSYAERSKNADLALSYLEAARSAPFVSDSTRIQMASAARVYAPDAFPRMLDELLAKQDASPSYATAVMTFLNRAGLPERTIAWRDALPAETQESVAVKESIVLAYLLQERWDSALGALLEKDWDTYEFKRLLLIAFAYDRRGNISARDQAFLQGLTEASKNARQIEEMRSKATLWNWTDLEAEAYRKHFRLNPLDKEAAGKIVAHDKATGDTEQLTITFATLMEADPQDLDAKNNFAYLNLLRKTNLKQALALASESVEKAPQRVPYKITHALALLRNDRPKDALEAIEKLRSFDFAEGESILTRAVILAANDRNGEAQSLIRLINSVGFLPEEDRMLSELKSSIARASSRIDDAETLRRLQRQLTAEQKEAKLFPAPVDASEQEDFDLALAQFQLGMHADAEVTLMDAEWDTQDHLRYAAIALLQRLRGQARLSNDSWSDAVLFASNRADRLAELRDFAELWDWADKRLAVARSLFDKDPRDQEAFEQLVAAYEEEKALADLVNVYEAHLKSTPDDLAAKAALSYIYLISEQNTVRGHLLVREDARMQSTPEGNKAAMASLLLRMQWGEVLTRFSSLSTLDQMTPEYRLMRSLALFNVGEEASARLEFSAVEASRLKFFEADFYESVKAALSDS